MNIVSACVNHLRHVLQLSARVRLDADDAGQATRPRFGLGRGVVERTAAPLRLGTGGAPLAISMSESEVISAHDLTGFFTALFSGGLTLEGVLTLLSDLDSTVHDEGSLGNSASLVLLLGLGGGLGNLSLIGDGLLVWDNNFLSSNLGSSTSTLGDEGTNTTSAWERDLLVELLDSVSSS